jgi:nitrogen fixation NifU-like protein
MMAGAMFDDLRDLYQEVILDHGRRPRHGSRLTAADATAKGDNPMCGDRVQVWVKYGADGEIARVGFEARGCAISIASADLMAEVIEGVTPARARALAEQFRSMVRSGEPGPDTGPEMGRLQPLSGVHEYPSRVKCATLPWHALLAALDGKAAASSE